MKLFEFVKLSLNPDQRTPLAPDGLHVAVQRADQGRAAVWMLDSNREAATRFTFARDNMQVAPLFSADGRRVLFTSSSQALGALAGIYEKAASGGGTERLVFESAQYKALTDWSSDGRVVLYTAVNEKTGGDVWALPLTGDRKPFPVVQTSFDERNGQFAPNGQWIAYDSNESGRFEVYVQRFPGPAGKWQISAGGGESPLWSRDADRRQTAR